MDATLHTPSMIKFTDILLGSTLPLHPYLIDHPRLSIRIIADGNICGETPSVDGDLATGIWEINSSLSTNLVKQSVTLAIVASKGNLSIRFASVKLSVAELLARTGARPNGYHEFVIGDSSCPVQLIISCSVKASPLSVASNRPSQVGAHDNYTVGRTMKKSQWHHAQKKSELPSRGDLESAHANVIRIPDQDKKADMLSMLGLAYHAYYQETGAKADLEKAISMHEEAMQFTMPFHPQLAEHAHHFAMALTVRFTERGDPVDIERAISHYRTVLEVTENLEDMPDRLSKLGNAFGLRFQSLDNLGDLENSISNLRTAVELTPDGHPDRPGYLNSLEIALRFRFLRLGNLEDLEDTNSNFRKAVELTPDGHPSRPDRLYDLGLALESRFERLCNLTDLEDAISNLRKAAEITPYGHPHRSRHFSGLGNVLRSHFERFGNLAKLEEAISKLRKAGELTPDGHPDKPQCLNNLGIALRSRFGHLSSLPDLEAAISNLQKAVEITPDGHRDRPHYLHNLGTALQSRFERLGSLTDLEDAISNFQKAENLTPDGRPDKPQLLNSLGNALHPRFRRLCGLTDVEDAVLHFRKATELTPNGHRDGPGFLNNLGMALQSRFERLGSLTDLEDAISNFQKADKLTPDGHPTKSVWLNNLGNTLQTRFQLLGNLLDLEGAISNIQKAYELVPEGHPDRPRWLNNLGNALKSRFECLGSLSDLDDAISSHQKVVKLAPDGHADLAGWLGNLGAALLARFRRLGILDDLESGLSALSTAANYKGGPAMVRFRAAREWAKMADKHARSPLDAFSCAIDLLPQIAWLGLAVTDQHALLADVGGIVRDAVAAAIKYDEYETAVVWAEQGRSIVWQNLLGLRNPIDDLREAYPELANRLRSITTQLEGSESLESLGDKGQTTLVEDVSHRYSKLALEWEALVDEIRRLPAFEGFLKAKSFSQLAPAAHESPVVILNVNDARCDALVLIADDSAERHVSAFSIPLERFSHEKSNKMFQTLTELLSSAGVRDRNDRKTGRAQSQVDGDAKFKAILGILWQDVVKPVIDGLAFQPQSNRPPRIWWCATGLLAFLPIHAAGLYNAQEAGQKAADYVVSSYTPTLTAMLELSDPVIREDFQVLTVAQAWAPGAQPIPKTEEEVQIIQDFNSSVRALNLTRQDATVKRVQEGMMDSNWIHLACHGQQNPNDPMESGFLLHDKILKLSEIVRMSLLKADFAFLSACQTAMGDEKVAEESVHLAAGMFLSGCRGVIATTWSIRDDDAPMIAREVYSRMLKDRKPNRKEAAYALHQAVKLLRKSGAPCTSWVPFIHIGR